MRFLSRLAKDLKKYRVYYMLALPAIIYYFIFSYKPMYGAIIAFKDFKPMKGIWGSPWVGLEHFQTLFHSAFFWDILLNTLKISLYSILFGFPAPIILALLLNEVRHTFVKRTVQSLTYIPHFISLVVICGLIKAFSGSDGLINDLIAWFGGERVSMLLWPEYFRTLYVSSGIWQEVGWGSIIYIAALAAIDVEQYEAARIDGAGRFKQLLHITLPGIKTTIIIMLILRLGHVMGVGYEKIILLYNPNTYSTADVISTYVYRKGVLEFNYSFSAAVGIFNSVIDFTILILANRLAKRWNETSLW
ncbi:ABC transporter permease [Paenibacillus roseipurpureus]|uniref:ABC transporter permease subunit n=1 Tax=Paenibacillus roseopurpureus TaxID=2918901 RepID=A0AA96LTX5_9BACL|nr:ABC transporter permease subunit [Paenibacillus sp. MBLB1832]WNR47097.1 ABC transporter permease subunit [Paenibacillus sp. MBLB1832]